MLFIPLKNKKSKVFTLKDTVDYSECVVKFKEYGEDNEDQFLLVKESDGETLIVFYREMVYTYDFFRDPYDAIIETFDIEEVVDIIEVHSKIAVEVV